MSSNNRRFTQEFPEELFSIIQKIDIHNVTVHVSMYCSLFYLDDVVGLGAPVWDILRLAGLARWY
jgi:hypothetical protein